MIFTLGQLEYLHLADVPHALFTRLVRTFCPYGEPTPLPPPPPPPPPPHCIATAPRWATCS